MRTMYLTRDLCAVGFMLIGWAAIFVVPSEYFEQVPSWARFSLGFGSACMGIAIGVCLGKEMYKSSLPPPPAIDREGEG